MMQINYKQYTHLTKLEVYNVGKKTMNGVSPMPIN